MQLMQGYDEHEVYFEIAKIDAALTVAFAVDTEMKTVALSYLLGSNLRTSKVTPAMAMAMVESASFTGKKAS